MLTGVHGMETTKPGTAVAFKLGGRLALIVASSLLPIMVAFGATASNTNVNSTESSSVVEAGRKIAHEGQQGVTPCSSCHAPQTVAAANGMYPQLRGLSARYIAKQLHDFQSGKRKSAIMGSMAKQLTDGQIKQVAAYYASLSPVPLGQSATNQALIKRGRRLAREGDLQSRVGSCINCHGVGGSGEFPAIPYLAYQQLDIWRRNLKPGSRERGTTTS